MIYELYDIYGDWEIIYCKNINLYDSIKNIHMEIFKEIPLFLSAEKFITTEHSCVNKNDIINDHHLYIVNLFDGCSYLYHVGGRVTDINNNFIPGAYRIRKIGYIIGK